MEKNNKTAEEHKALMLLKSFQNELFLRLYKPEHDQLNEIIDLVIEMENQISSDWYISIINKEQKKRINELDERIKELEAALRRIKSECNRPDDEPCNVTYIEMQVDSALSGEAVVSKDKERIKELEIVNGKLTDINKTKQDILNECCSFKQHISNGNYNCVGVPYVDALRAMEEYASLQSSEKDERIKELEKQVARYRNALVLIRDWDDDIEAEHGDPGELAIAALKS